MKLYCSGPISGYPDLNAKAFNDAAKVLRANGYEVVNPIELGEPEGWSHEQFMRRDLALLLECDGLAMLPGAEWSKGALQERDTAFAAGLPVLPWWVWLEKAATLQAKVNATLEAVAKVGVTYAPPIQVTQAEALGSGMTPDQLRRLADKIAKANPYPRADMDPSTYLASLTSHGLADAMREVANEDEAYETAWQARDWDEVRRIQDASPA